MPGYLRIDVIIHHGTESRLREGMVRGVRAVRIIYVIYLSEQEVRHGGSQRCDPANQRHQAGSPDVRHREDVERGADGEISLQREGEDCHHRGVRGSGIEL